MRYQFLHHSRGLIAATLLIGSMPAESALMTFSERTAFEAATTNLTTISFEGIVPTNAAQNFTNPAGLTTAGVNFHTSGTGPFGPGHVSVYGAGQAAMQSAVLNTGTGAILVWGPPNQPGTAFLDVVLPGGTTAFAADFWAQQPFITTAHVTVTSGGSTEDFDIGTVSRPTPSFFGVTSDTSITSVRFSIPAQQVGLVLDNVSLGTADPLNPIPEPGSLLLLFAGGAAMGVVRRFQQQT